MSKESKPNPFKKLQLKMLRIQQGVWHSKGRVIIAIEGIDAAGKGGAIRRFTETLDPRGFKVHPIGPPTAEEQGKHWLFRFWEKLPAKGMIAVFDRTWYGRVLVERIEKLISKEAWTRGYEEINQFEKLLIDDGVKIIKIFLKISKKEQLKRFEERLDDPYKQWKISEDDIRNRSNWDVYSKAVLDMLKETDTKTCPWHIIETDDKDVAREMVLKVIAKELKGMEEWIEKRVRATDTKQLKKTLSLLP